MLQLLPHVIAALTGALPLHVIQPEDELQATLERLAEVREIANEYVHQSFVLRDLDAVEALHAPDFYFIDPTGEIFGGPVAEGVTGSAAFRKLVESWNIEASRFEIEQHFASGEHALFIGQFEWQAAGQPAPRSVPFATIIRVQDGMVTERRDYGDYDRLFPRLNGKDAALERTAMSYVDAFAASDFERLGQALALDVRLVDRAAARWMKAPLADKSAVLAHLEQASQQLSDFELDPTFTFYCGRHAFILSTARYQAPRKSPGEGRKTIDFEHALLLVLEMKDGKVQEHRSYIDAESWLSQMTAGS